MVVRRASGIGDDLGGCGGDDERWPNCPRQSARGPREFGRGRTPDRGAVVQAARVVQQFRRHRRVRRWCLWWRRYGGATTCAQHSKRCPPSEALMDMRVSRPFPLTIIPLQRYARRQTAPSLHRL